MAAHPVRYAVVSAGSLALLSLFALAFNPTFDFSDSSTEQTESGQALITFQKGQPSGAADPTSVLLRSTDGQPLDDAALKTYATELGTAKGVASAALAAQTDDVAVFTVVLSDDPGSDAALANVEGPVRDTAHSAAPDGTEAFVGGTTSIFVDLDDAMARDYSVVFPVAARADHDHPGAAAAQPGRAVVPHALGGPRFHRRPGCDGAGLPGPAWASRG